MVIEILTGILVLVTMGYAYLTYRLAQASEASVVAMQNQSEALLRPYIAVATFIRPHTPYLYMRVKNIGKTGAQNLQLTLDRDFFQFGHKDRSEKNLRLMSAFSNPIDSFPPGAELIFALGPGWEFFGENERPDICPTQFNITAIYEYLGKKVKEEHRIDLRPYLGTEGELDPVVEELEKIRKIMEKQVV